MTDAELTEKPTRLICFDLGIIGQTPQGLRSQRMSGNRVSPSRSSVTWFCKSVAHFPEMLDEGGKIASRRALHVHQDIDNRNLFLFLVLRGI